MADFLTNQPWKRPQPFKTRMACKDRKGQSRSADRNTFNHWLAKKLRPFKIKNGSHKINNRDIRKMAKQLLKEVFDEQDAYEAAEVQRKIMRDETIDPRLRADIAERILDRRLGKATQTTKVEGGETKIINLTLNANSESAQNIRNRFNQFAMVALQSGEVDGDGSADLSGQPDDGLHVRLPDPEGADAEPGLARDADQRGSEGRGREGGAGEGLEIVADSVLQPLPVDPEVQGLQA